MEAIVGAGGLAKPEDPLYELVGNRPKAMMPIGGKPMVQWVLDALAEARRIEQVIVVGLDESHGLTCGDKPIDYLPSVGGLFDNVNSALKHLDKQNNSERYTMFVSADIPLITSQMIDWLADQANSITADLDLAYVIIRKAVMEKRFPNARRTYFRIKDGRYCGGDINIVNTRVVKGSNPVWNQVVEARKSFRKQVSLIGIKPLLLLLFGQMTIARGLKIIEERIGIQANIIETPYAEMGMDVDKPAQYQLARKELE